MHIVIGGASGLIGRALVTALRDRGDRVTRLVRHAPSAPDEVRWLNGTPLDPDVVAGADAVVGLNGASIGRLPWTRGYRSRLLWSRITPARTLARAIEALPAAERPLFASASAVGFYGSRRGQTLTEDSRPGSSFLASLCVEWEHAARIAGERVALLRTAPILHPDAVLKPLIALTRAGIAGPLGSGTQAWPWISLEDEVAAILHVLDRGLTGPVNLAGPTRATANDIGFALARRLNRPYVLRAPAPALRLALGERFANDMLLTDAHVVPKALASSGFAFRHRTAEDAIAAAIAR
ncbi:TIGR01777 family protein [Microbacterium paludicola]|uniref:TIGR01777 family protein n=1 Tax=Microbacterium paludicola TaxID=300019 RepID=A0A4Y9FVV9_9MICO|nr:TIGR01777 family oxidoreductase [Microbacterium paludicola]MBF0815817.1 TIGR01777 family protein [Microbacterium paludicola]TFU33461.1 TIGR01777 family protein [Microbacterium paludicola]